MDTSGESLPSILLFIVVLVLFVTIAIRIIPARPRPFPVVAVVAVITIGVPSLLQFAVPEIGAALTRSPDLTIHHGQWWRILTAIAAQDGGLVAAIFNLLVIAAAVAVGEWVWGRWRAVVLYLLPSVVLNLVAVFVWHATGGGSSFADDGLMLSVCGLGLVASSRVVVRVCASAAILVGVVLVVLGDAHGVAMLLGAALGILFALLHQDRARRRVGVVSPA